MRFIVLFFCLLWQGMSFATEPKDTLTARAMVLVDQHVIDGTSFDPSPGLDAAIRWHPQSNSPWSLEAAIASTLGAETEEECDNTGCYTLTLDARDLLLGGVYQFSEQEFFNRQWLPFVRGGLLLYTIDVELEESFYGLKPEGKTTTDDTGSGFYLGLGADFELGDLPLTWELLYRSRLDVLGDSSSPFDMNSISFGIGMRFGL